MPVAKVLFCDCQRFADMLRDKSVGAQMKLMSSFWSATWLHLVERIVADQQVIVASFQVFLSKKIAAQEYDCTHELL